MRKLSDFKTSKYFIVSTNTESIYKKISDEVFVAVYSKNFGLLEIHERYHYFEYYPDLNFKYIELNEYEKVINGKYDFRDMYRKYFGY